MTAATAHSVRRVRSVTFRDLIDGEYFIHEDDAVSPRGEVPIYIKTSNDSYREAVAHWTACIHTERNKGVVKLNDDLRVGLPVVRIQITDVTIQYVEKPVKEPMAEGRWEGTLEEAKKQLQIWEAKGWIPPRQG